MAQAQSRAPQLAAIYKSMASHVANERAAGYERLIEQARASPSDAELLAKVGSLLAGCHALESDEAAAARLRSALLRLLPAPDAPLPAGRADQDLQFWAAQTSAALLDRRGLKPERSRALSADLQRPASRPWRGRGK
jgi:hypothetical protein